jgi:hypothetical protein
MKWFRSSSEVIQGRHGPQVEGYIYNNSFGGAEQLLVGVEQLSPSGQAVSLCDGLGRRQRPATQPCIFCHAGAGRQRAVSGAYPVIQLDENGRAMIAARSS